MFFTMQLAVSYSTQLRACAWSCEPLASERALLLSQVHIYSLQSLVCWIVHGLLRGYGPSAASVGNVFHFERLSPQVAPRLLIANSIGRASIHIPPPPELESSRDGFRSGWLLLAISQALRLCPPLGSRACIESPT